MVSYESKSYVVRNGLGVARTVVAELLKDEFGRFQINVEGKFRHCGEYKYLRNLFKKYGKTHF